MIDLGRLARRLRGATLIQAARAAEAVSRMAGKDAQVGRDHHPSEEPIRFAASDRLHLVVHDIAQVEARDERLHITGNLLGLAGATPALPPAYSELQLQRRRARDPGFAAFLNLFDHRALSFFYRIAAKFRWPLLAEAAGREGREPVVNMLGALAGIGSDGVRARLDIGDAALAPLVAQLGDTRRSAAGLATVLRLITGLPLRVVEACPVWIAVPPSEQTRLGARGMGRFAQLGEGAGQGLGTGEAAMIGASVLDVQHHYIVEVGPVSRAQLQQFSQGDGMRRLIAQLCFLAAGIDQRPSMRLLIAVNDIPPLRLGDDGAPGLLGWTSWMGKVEREGGIAGDCVIPLDLHVAHAKSVV